MHKYTVAAVALAALIVVQSAMAQRPMGYAEEVLHKNSMPYQRRNSKSMSFIENFFPHSRSAKVSNAFNESKANQTESTSSISISTEETTNPIPISTQDEGRATGSTRKTTQTTKRKPSSTRNSSSTTPKTTKHTQKATTTKPMTSNTPKTTHKQYTIYPSTMIKTNPSSATTSYKPKTESTTTKITTKAVTLAELAKVTESAATTKLSPGTTISESSTDLDGREGELELKEKQQLIESKNETVSLPAVLAKPTKYHYYPHNQHIYLLPECAIQQVCNAVYVRLNYTQPLCACPARYRDPCSASLNADDLHTTLLTTDSKKKYAQKAVTLVKTCEATSEMRECRAPRDWSLLALQNIRTGKSHYLVICKCPEEYVLEGPMSHDQPTYASVPGIRVYGMMCVQPPKPQYSSIGHSSRPTTSSYKVGYSQPHYNQDQTFNRYPGYIGPGVYYNRMARKIRERRSASEQLPPFPWEKARELALMADWEN